jgi:hypothetical protein
MTKPKASQPPAAEWTAAVPDALLRGAWWMLLGIALAAMLFIRIRLLEIPLERDEGEYAYSGQLMLQGVPPYQLAYNMKLPGTYAAYAVLMAIFGQTTAGIHLGLLVVNAATVALIFAIAKRLLGLSAAVAASASYAVLSFSPALLGFAGHATHFVVLPVLGAVLLLLRGDRPGNVAVLGAGVLLGVGVLMKQPGVFFVPFGAALLASRDRERDAGWREILLRIALLFVGAALPMLLTALLLWWAGVFEKFWFWTVVYAREYGSVLSLSQGAEVFARAIKPLVRPAFALWALGAAGAVACLVSKKLRASAPVLIGLLIFGALATTPGLYFRQHYFIVALPAVCLLIGAAVAWADGAGRRALAFAAPVVFAAALGSAVYAERVFFFTLDPIAASRSIYGTNPFPESERIGAFLRERSNPEDRILIMGSEPQIFFHAQRRSATGYIYIYSLMEPQPLAAQMHREMIAEAEAANPKFLVLVAVNASWLASPRSEKLVYEWMSDQLARNFRLVGFADIISNERTEYHLPATPGTQPTSPVSVMIYERI